MLRYLFQTYFIFLVCIIIQINYGIAQENASGESAALSNMEPREKCTVKYCTCSEIPLWHGVDCEDDYQSKLPTLHFNNSKYLPGRMFQELRIHTIYLRDPDATVAENVLEGILGLNEFRVERSSIEVVPDFSTVKNSIRYVKFTSSCLTSLEGKNLQNLTSARLLIFTNNSIRYVEPDVFKGTYNVRTLDFSHNKLTSIPPKLLDPMKRLGYFSVHHNNLLHVDNLFFVTRPLFINFAFNNITDFSLRQFFNLENADPFSKINIVDLDLSYNLIKETPLSLSTCDGNQGNLILSGNELQSLNDCLRCLGLNILEIIGTQLQFLTEKDFMSVNITGVNGLLNFRENQIRRIDTDTFRHLNTSSLRTLDLSSNKITSINGSVKYLSNLRMLNLSHNSIQTIAEDEFTGLHSLLQMYLQNNHIKSLGTTLQKLDKLEVLNATHNNIELIKTDQIPDTLKSTSLAGNPLKCDCKNLPFIDMLKDDKEQAMCLRYGLENTLQKHIDCPDVCSCECAEYGEDFAMFIDCSSRNLSHVPHFMENNLVQLEVNETFSSDDRRYHVMYQNLDPSLHLKGDVLGINLENNRLDILDEAQIPPNLVQLYLANNKLRRFPQSVFDNQLNLKQVSLSGNPWQCDCDAMEFKKWITSYNHTIKDYDNIRCGISDEGGRNFNGSVLWKISDLDLCPVKDSSLAFSVPFGVLAFVAVCLFGKVIYTKYELNIKVSLYSHGFTFVKEKVLDCDKAFDAFISFSHKDDEFVIKEIVSEIENRDPNVRLCLHYRHFRPGELITDNIRHAVRKSKRTVLILSSNFIESDWCLLEFKTALKQTLQDKVHRIIAVKIEELPEEIDPTIKVYLNSTTYLSWGESNFWNKLLYILPSRSNVSSPVLRFVGDNEIVFNFSYSDP